MNPSQPDPHHAIKIRSASNSITFFDGTCAWFSIGFQSQHCNMFWWFSFGRIISCWHL